MKLAILLICFIALALAENAAHKHFFNFMNEHGKSYDNDDVFLHRFNIFRENLKRIEQWNAESTGAVYGVTQFSDLTPQEFKSLYLMNVTRPPNATTYLTFPGVEAPTTFDWRTKGAVTNVKNQGQCGSCWAFSATSNIESVVKLGGQSMPILGPQQMVDCDKDCYGCQGGWPSKAFNYVAKAGGQDTESAYPYTGRDGSCKFKTQGIGAKIKGYHSISRDEKQMQAGLSTTAPFSICVDASQWSHYKSGVMRSNQCGRGIDHCVQLVGYDSTANPPYWMVRNSWGTGWGVSGYIYLEMFKDTCAMAEQVTTAYL
jgi:cathepsin F